MLVYFTTLVYLQAVTLAAQAVQILSALRLHRLNTTIHASPCKLIRSAAQLSAL